MTPRRVIGCSAYLAAVVAYCAATGQLRYLASILAFAAAAGVVGWGIYRLVRAVDHARDVIDDILAELPPDPPYAVRDELPEPRRVA